MEDEAMTEPHITPPHRAAAGRGRTQKDKKMSEEDIRAKVTNYFGGCPECGGDDGYLNYRRNHYFICKAHKTSWHIGSNLFSDWRYETEDDWKRNAELLDGFREVMPVHAPEEKFSAAPGEWPLVTFAKAETSGDPQASQLTAYLTALRQQISDAIAVAIKNGVDAEFIATVLRGEEQIILMERVHSNTSDMDDDIPF
jgi:hypothetical protein